MRAVCADEDVADGGSPVRERRLVSAISKRADGEGMVPLDRVWRDGVEHDLAQGRAVDLGTERARARVPIGVHGGGAEDALAVAIRVSVTFW